MTIRFIQKNYENINSLDKYSQTLILANNHVGGVAGQLENSTVKTAYSYSYVSYLNEAIIEVNKCTQKELQEMIMNYEG